MDRRYTTPSAFQTRYVECPLQDLTKTSIVKVVKAACPENSKSPQELKSPTLTFQGFGFISHRFGEVRTRTGKVKRECKIRGIVFVFMLVCRCELKSLKR